MNELKPTSPPSKWARLFTPRTNGWLFGIPFGAVLFFVLGLAVYGGGSTFIAVTSTDHFCAYACHEMTAFAAPSWLQSSHYKNAQGVHAGCPDCHLPGPEIPKLEAKVHEGLKDAWGHLTGAISTQAKFDAKKAQMARDVWAAMKASDSRECRHCHNAAAWDVTVQSHSAQRQHEKMKTSGETCIDCHHGVVHEVPLGAEPGS